MHNHCNDLSILCTTSTLVSLYHVLVYNQFDSGLYIGQQESYNETRYKVKNILFNLVHQLFNLLYRLFTLILLTLLFQPCVTYIGFSASHYLHWLHPTIYTSALASTSGEKENGLQWLNYHVDLKNT